MGVNVRITSTILASVCFVFPLACGTGPASGSSSGPPVEPSKTLAALSSSEMGAFCDWTNQKEGGYGRVIECDASGVPLETDPDQATCVAELTQHASEPNCSATVGQWTMCFEWLLANWCTTMPSMMPAECNVIQTTCYGSGGLPIDGGGD
jgi:hypothetical protein